MNDFHFNHTLLNLPQKEVARGGCQLITDIVKGIDDLTSSIRHSSVLVRVCKRPCF
jgi:hypothetical protein